MMNGRFHSRRLLAFLVLLFLIGPFVSAPPFAPIVQHVSAADMLDNVGFNVDGIGLDGPRQNVMFSRIGETHFGWSSAAQTMHAQRTSRSSSRRTISSGRWRSASPTTGWA
ncbi:MAG: hypothetical protein ACR2JW_12230 [Thermomicrobiales bacterium]